MSDAKSKRKGRPRPSPTNARELALEALIRVFDDGAYSNLSLDALLKKYALSNEDKRLATTLFYGTLGETFALDELIERYSSVRIAKMDVIVRCILRMGFWQLFFSAVPNSAAVNEAVNLCRRSGFTSAASLVNAVLRQGLRRETQYVPQSLAAKSGFAPELAADLQTWLGSEAEVLALGQSLREARGLSLRLRIQEDDEVGRARLLREIAESGFEVSPAAFQPSAVHVVTRGQSLTSLPAWQRGAVRAQGEAAMLPAQALDPKPGDTVWDLCAAPGGKSLQLAEMVGGEGRVYAADLREQRVHLMQKEFARLDVNNIIVFQADATTALDWQAAAKPDRILLDVPCSGLGLIGSKPELKLAWNSRAVSAELVPLQKAILEQASGQLRSGGSMVYSTCTLNPAENQEQIRGFLARHPDYHLAAITGQLGAAGDKLQQLDPSLYAAMAEGMITLWPHRTHSEGFFVALLQKE